MAAAALWGTTGTTAHFAPAGATPAAIGAARIVVGGALLLLVGLCSRTPGGGDPGKAASGAADVQPADGPDASDLRPADGPGTADVHPADGPEPPDVHPADGPHCRGAALRSLLAARGRRRAAVLAGALSVAGYQLCFFSAVRLTGVAIGTLVAIGSGPVWTGLISVPAGVRPDLRWLLATTAAIGGCAVLLAGGHSAGVQLDGVVLALAAGLCYACYAVTAARLISTGAGHRPVMAALFGGGAIALLPVLLAGPVSWLLTLRGIAVVGELSVVTTLIAYLLYGRGLRSVPAPAAVTFGLAEPVVAALLAIVILGERLTAASAAGLLLIGGALAVLAAPGPAGRPLRENRLHG